ncbi:MAG: helix-turn-helix domain-containing protein [Thermoplasmata archaeon]|nr:MAG: helix-turn-helix domain-containing protein [Thermoplasmata archaeon]
MDSTSLMFELSHPERMKILQLLEKEPMRLSDISKILDVTTTEVSRHLERLGRAKLLERNSKNRYHITSFAKIILSESSKFDYLIDNMDFFLDHDLSILPQHLHWFTSMAEGEIIEGALENASLIWDYNSGAKKYIHVISDEAMRGVVDITSKKIDQGVEVKKIYQKDAKIPPEYISRIRKKNHEIRTLDVIPLAFIITEKNTGMSFRSNNGKVDFSAGFTGDSESFRRWVNAIFDYFWDKAKPLR